MENDERKGLGDHPFVVIVGVIASLIAILVFFTGKENLPQIILTLTSKDVEETIDFVPEIRALTEELRVTAIKALSDANEAYSDVAKASDDATRLYRGDSAIRYNDLADLNATSDETKARADRAMAITEDVKNRADRLLRRLGAEPLSNKGDGDRLESGLKDIKTTAGMAQARAKDAFQYANEFDEKLSRIFRYEK